MTSRRRSFGRIESRPNGLWRAAYVGPDGILYRQKHYYVARVDAEGWLAGVKRQIDSDSWEPPDVVAARADAQRRRNVTLASFADEWLPHRDLRPRTRSHYRMLLDSLILPQLGPVALNDITPSMVKNWHRSLPAEKPTVRSHAYGLLRTLLNDALREQLVVANPCTIRGAGSVKRKRDIQPLTAPQLGALADAMPDRLRLAVLLAGWAALRFGELTELRRGDVDVARGTVRVARAVVRVDGRTIVGRPKSDAGRRTVSYPPHIADDVAAHLDMWVGSDREALLFPGANGGHLAPSSLYGRRPATRQLADGNARATKGSGFYAARAAIGRPDLAWHDLRHTGSVLAALSGANVRELQTRLGHSTAVAAMLYQHAVDGRDAEIARGLSRLARSDGSPVLT